MASVRVIPESMRHTDMPARSWTTLEDELVALRSWVIEHCAEADGLVDRIVVGNERREIALLAGEDATSINARIAEIRQQLLGLDTNVRMLFAVRVALFARDVLGECELHIRAVAEDGVVTEFRVAP